MWWLPDEPDQQVPGILRYDPEGGLDLSLIGAFENRISTNPAPGVTAFHDGSKTWDVIHGAAEQREITLLGCVPTLSTRTYGARVKSPAKQTVKATTAIVGAHVNGEEDAAFTEAEVSIEDLGLWAATSVFEAVIGASANNIDGTGRISVNPVESPSVIVEGTEYRLTHTHTLPSFDQRRGATTGRMRDTTFIRVAPPEPFTLTAALRAAGLMQDLIALATHRAAGVIWLRLVVAETESAPANGQPVRRRRAEVIYPPSTVGDHDAKAVDHHRVFFTCDALPFAQILPRWHETHERLKASINMILGLRYAPAQFIENNLLTAVGAAEVLHRGLRIDERPMPQAAFREMRHAMLEQVPEEHKARLKSVLRNEPILRDRLLALAGRPDQEAISLLVPDVAHWAERATRARNDLAHTGSTPNHSLGELIAVVEVTTTVVILNVLHELGLPPERQRQLMQEHPQLRKTAETARDCLGAAPAL